jgi:hypothetical protein
MLPLQNCIEMQPGFDNELPIGVKIQLEKENLAYNFDGVFGADTTQSLLFN